MEKPVLIYCPFPDREAALSVAKRLVEEKLVACVNILPGMMSVYMWQGQVESSDEIIALFKTCSSLKDKAGEAIRKLHPYEVPVIVYLATEGAEEGTMAWIMREIGGW